MKNDNILMLDESINKLIRANHLRSNKEYKEAVKLYRDLVETIHDSIELFILIADCYFKSAGSQAETGQRTQYA